MDASSENLAPYLAGEKLYGDDFTPPQIEQWHRDEREAYAELRTRDDARPSYAYHALNRLHGFRHLRSRHYDHALGVGSARADEFAPLARRIERLTVLEPSGSFRAPAVHGIPCSYVAPVADGSMPFDDATFDLLTCLGVLHHVPNVTAVVREMYRCLAPGGDALVREPIVSLGDWRAPRPGLTSRERGIPLELFRRILREAGFTVFRERMCVFPVVHRAVSKLGGTAYNNHAATRLDAALSALFRWNLRYHATRPIHKLRPQSVYYVLTKPGT